jgi:hypothetical protein
MGFLHGKIFCQIGQKTFPPKKLFANRLQELVQKVKKTALKNAPKLKSKSKCDKNILKVFYFQNLVIFSPKNREYGTLKHLEKICSVLGGHLISMNFPPRNWEGYYAYF